jgi:hypothetical protein
MEEEPGDIIRVTPRSALTEPGVEPPRLPPEALERARALMPGRDVYALEAEWRGVWVRSGRPRLRSPGAAFLGWVRKRAQEA